MEKGETTAEQLKRWETQAHEFFETIHYDRPLTAEERRRGEAANAAVLAELGIDPDDE